MVAWVRTPEETCIDCRYLKYNSCMQSPYTQLEASGNGYPKRIKDCNWQPDAYYNTI